MSGGPPWLYSAGFTGLTLCSQALRFSPLPGEIFYGTYENIDLDRLRDIFNTATLTLDFSGTYNESYSMSNPPYSEGISGTSTFTVSDVITASMDVATDDIHGFRLGISSTLGGSGIYVISESNLGGTGLVFSGTLTATSDDGMGHSYSRTFFGAGGSATGGDRGIFPMGACHEGHQCKISIGYSRGDRVFFSSTSSDSTPVPGTADIYAVVFTGSFSDWVDPGSGRNILFDDTFLGSDYTHNEGSAGTWMGAPLTYRFYNYSHTITETSPNTGGGTITAQWDSVTVS